MWKLCGTAQAQGKERDKGHLTEIRISGSNKRLSQHLSKEDLEQLVKERHFFTTIQNSPDITKQARFRLHPKAVPSTG